MKQEVIYPDLKGHIAIVTGGAGDIGKAIISELARQNVNGAIADLPSRIDDSRRVAKNQYSEYQAKWIPIGCDVQDKDQVSGMVEEVYNEFGKINFLVNNAGLIWMQPLMEMGKEDFDKVMGVNFYSAIACTQAVVPYMQKNEVEQERGNIRGKIINISSTSGLRVGKDSLLYSATKHGLIFLTDDILLELGEKGIASYAIAPGIFPSHGYDYIKYAKRKGKTFTDQAEARKWVTENYRQQIPLGRVGKMEEIGQLVTFLLSERGDFLNGSLLPITGGRF